MSPPMNDQLPDHTNHRSGSAERQSDDVIPPSTICDTSEVSENLQNNSLSNGSYTFLQHGDSLVPGVQYTILQPPNGENENLSGRNAAFEDVWEEKMADLGTTGTPHKKTAVLMVYWDQELSDLDTGPEIKELTDIFKNKFRYEVVEGVLQPRTSPKHQLAKHLATFFEVHDNDSTLLIIYYAGHGIRGHPGELYLGSKNKNPARQGLPEDVIPWHKMEFHFGEVKADVLLIFDCCYAGNLEHHLGRGYWATKSFELLAACKHDQTTHPPGRHSFTRALIWSLENLSTREKFSTYDLEKEIQHAPDFPKGQVVRIIDRGGPCDHRLVLAPLPAEADGVKQGTPVTESPVNASQEYTELRFWYTKALDEEQIKELAANLRRLILDGNIQANRITWAGLGHANTRRPPMVQVQKYVDIWKMQSGRKRRSAGNLNGPLLSPVDNLTSTDEHIPSSNSPQTTQYQAEFPADSRHQKTKSMSISDTTTLDGLTREQTDTRDHDVDLGQMQISSTEAMGYSPEYFSSKTSGDLFGYERIVSHPGSVLAVGALLGYSCAYICNYVFGRD